jgi:hypothetical protein
MNYNDEFDPVLEEALAEYRDAEPLDGVEERVLHRMRLAHQQRRNLWYRWSAALACAALAAIAAWIGLQRRPEGIVQPQPNVAQRLASPSSTVPVATKAASRSGRKGAQSRHGVVSANLRRAGTVAPSRALMVAGNRGKVPRSQPGKQFPTPSPLTSEERALIALARTYPQVFESSGTNADVRIAPIEVQPLSELHSDSEGNHQ